MRKFSVGSIVFAPYPKKREKPAIVIEIDDLKKNKFILRRTGIKLEKISNSAELKFLSKTIIKDVQDKAKKINKSPEAALEKLFSKKIIREINKMSEISDLANIQNYVKKLTPKFINDKLRKYLPKKRTLTDTDKNHGKIKTIGSLLVQPKIKKTSLHSEKHFLVDEIRNYFGENAKKGVGSFSFYLGFFSKIPATAIYQYWSEVKQSRQSIAKQQKIFWWKIGEHLRDKSKKKH